MENAALSKYLPILEVIYTKDQAKAFQDQLDVLFENIFLTGVSAERKIEELFTVEIKDGIITALTNEGIALTDSMQIKNFLLPLKKELEVIPQIKLQLAFEPTAQTLKRISSWFLISMKKKYLIDIQVNKEIVGGVVLTANGLSRDYSIKQVISSMKEKGLFISLLENG